GDCRVVEGCGAVTLAMPRPSTCSTAGGIMAEILLGSGKYTYEPVEGWGKLPEGWRYVEVAGVDVDSKDNVYLITRGEHPVIVFDREGNFLRSWGEGLFSRRTCAIHLGPDASVYCTTHDTTSFP